MTAAQDLHDVYAAAMQRESNFRPRQRPAVSVGAIAEAISGSELIGSSDVTVTGVCLDSRAILPGDLYAALPGAHVHGSRFIPAAIERGAAAIVTDQAGADAARAAGATVVVVPNLRAVLGAVSAVVYGTTTHHPTLFGVTGTNGKTTTSFMVSSVLQAMGRRTGTIGTIGIAVGEEYIPSTMTTPEAPQLHGLLARMDEANVSDAVMEVSSHSMVFARTAGLRYAVAGFTNLSPDHLDLHGTMENYFEAKRSLFSAGMVDRAIITVDDEWGVRMAEAIDIPFVTLATREGADADWSVADIEQLSVGNRFTLRHRDGRSLDAVVGLPGDFNVSNAALALVMVIEAGNDIADVARAVASSEAPLSSGVPGRMELVHESPRVYVDFAHNPGGLLRVLQNVQTPAGRVILVFGAAGERDAVKRASMGAIAAEFSDVAIVTDDDPHAEDAQSIRAQVLEGARGARQDNHEVLEIFPRAVAIARAVTMAQADDIVVVAGRGHETVQDIAGALIDIDDRDEVRKAFASITPAPHSNA